MRRVLRLLAVMLLAMALTSRALIPVAQGAFADGDSPFDLIQICTADGIVSVPVGENRPAAGQSHEGCCLGACSISCCVAPPVGGFVAMLEEQARQLKAALPSIEAPVKRVLFNTRRRSRAPPVILA